MATAALSWLTLVRPEEIATRLNAQKVPTIHGTNRWTASDPTGLILLAGSAA